MYTVVLPWRAVLTTAFWMRDEEGPDAKLLCVPATDPRFRHLQELEDAKALAARLESVGGMARWCGASDVPDLVVETAGAFPNQPVIYTDAVASLLPGLVRALEERGVSLVPARSIDDALSSPVALSTGELAIAETGSVLTANRELSQRGPTMLSTTHFILVPEEKLVADLGAA